VINRGVYDQYLLEQGTWDCLLTWKTSYNYYFNTLWI